ncbi:MAG: nucleotide exchange factor GrpE [bacterium]|nr:nucleotide exchange factor GrpE [bacterium]
MEPSTPNNTENDFTLEPSEDAESLRDPAEKLRKLKDELIACKAERQEYLTGWQRARADYANVKKEEERNRESIAAFASERLIGELIPALDSFHTAFGNREAWEKIDTSWRMGIEHIYAQLRSALEKNGLRFIEPKKGEVFDPKLHQSVAVVHVSQKELDHTIIEVMQKGYALYDKILEPAKVGVGEYQETR